MSEEATAFYAVLSLLTLVGMIWVLVCLMLR